MGRKADAALLKDQWESERKAFPEEFLSGLADMNLKDIESICKKEFDPETAKAIQWQAMITKAHRSPADFAEIVSGGSWMRAPHLDLLNDLFVDACYNQRYIIVSISVRHGKLLTLDTPIATPEG